MIFIEKDTKDHPRITAESFVHYSNDDAKEIIRFNIAKDIANACELAVDDDNDETFVIMNDRSEQDYLSLYSKEFSIVVYFLGLTKGVNLDKHDISNIVQALAHQI